MCETEMTIIFNPELSTLYPFLAIIIFLKSFRFIIKLKGRHRDLYPLCLHMHSLNIIHIPYQSGTFFAKDGPVLTHHNHPSP